MDNIEFLEVEKDFRDHISYQVKRYHEDKNCEDLDEMHLNICCDYKDQQFIEFIKNEIIKIPKYSKMRNKDIYRVLIYLVYSLTLIEQSEEWLFSQFLYDKLHNKKLAHELLFEIILGHDNFSKNVLLTFYLKNLYGIKYINTNIVDNKDIQEKRDYLIKNAEVEFKNLNQKLKKYSSFGGKKSKKTPKKRLNNSKRKYRTLKK